MKGKPARKPVLLTMLVPHNVQYRKKTYAKVAAMTRWESIRMGKIGNNLVLLPRPVNQVSHTAKAVQKIPEATMRKIMMILLQA